MSDPQQQPSLGGDFDFDLSAELAGPHDYMPTGGDDEMLGPNLDLDYGFGYGAHIFASVADQKIACRSLTA